LPIDTQLAIRERPSRSAAGNSLYAVIIPAYCPSDVLIELCGDLRSRGVSPIIVIDDGSGEAYDGVFHAVSEIEGVTVLHHAVNLGKGAALKTGFNFVLCTMPDVLGVVTADADGQHHPADIQEIAASLVARPNQLTLGARSFDGGHDVPLRSRVGNIATRSLVRVLLNEPISDTQTGLRAIPAELMRRLMRSKSMGYEFESEMLLVAHDDSVKFSERPIRTIYHAQNASSHFNPLADSVTIYSLLLRYGLASMSTALLDYIVFLFVFAATKNLLYAQVAGRAASIPWGYGVARSKVFKSQQPHGSAFFQYVLLVAANGCVSYFGVRALAGFAPIVVAKIVVESLLWCATFAVQRLLIFRRDVRAPAIARTKAIHPFGLLAAIALFALVVVELHGVAVQRIFSQEIWLDPGWTRFLRYTKIYSVVALALVLSPPSVWLAFIGLGLVLTAMSTGVAAVAATILFLWSCSALGSIVLARAERFTDELCAFLTGAGIYILFMTATARLPVHSAPVWITLLLAPIVADFPGASGRLRRIAATAQFALSQTLTRVAAVALFFVMGAHWLIALKPEKGNDALAMHLAVAMDIVRNHRLTFEPARFVWSVMPMGADWCYAIGTILGGEFAAHLVNFAMLVTLCLLLIAALKRSLGFAAAISLVALFATTPLVQLVTGSLFIENTLAAMIFGSVTALWRFWDTKKTKFFLAGAFLCGSAVAVKFGAVAIAVVLAPIALGSLRRKNAWIAGWAMVIFLAAALPTYAIAFAKTGSPLFPFRNAVFSSKLIPKSETFRDERFREKPSFLTPYNVTFHTRRYFEGQDGALGLAFFFVVPLGLLGLMVRRPPQAVSAAVVATGASALILCTEPNVRYIYPCLALMMVPFGGLLDWSQHNAAWFGKLIWVIVLISAAANIYLLPSSSYYHKDFVTKPFSLPIDARHREQSPDIRNAIDDYNALRGDSSVLFASATSFAGTEGVVYENNWHQFSTQNEIRNAGDVPALMKLLQSWNVHYVIARKPGWGENLDPAPLRELLASCTFVESEHGFEYLARIDASCRTKQLSAAGYAVPPGAVDDYDPAIVYRGQWTHDEQFSEPYLHTVSYSNQTGAYLSIAFDGTALVYLCDRAPNRGTAEILIDGKFARTIDLYAAAPEWHHHELLGHFARGRHTAVIRVGAQKNPAATDHYVDLDLFEVK